MIAQRCLGRSLSSSLAASLLLAVAFAGPASAQAPTQAPARPAAPPAPVSNPAYDADVGSIDSILAALYASISGDAGVKRDWDRFRNLFVPGARLIPTGQRPDGSGGHNVVTAEDYATRSGPVLERDGFHEREIGRHVDRYGRIAQVFSAYDSKRTLADAAPFMRGINSIQLWNDGKRWWVVTIYWEHESPGNPIPAQYLHKP